MRLAGAAQTGHFPEKSLSGKPLQENA